jgi:hypothetical protein
MDEVSHSSTTKQNIREAMVDLSTPTDQIELRRLVEKFIQSNFDHANFSTSLNGIHVTWPNEHDTVAIDGEETSVDEPFLRLFFQYYHEDATDDPHEPFLNRVPYVELDAEDATGERTLLDGLEVDPGDDLYDEVRTRFALTATSDTDGAEGGA